MKAIIVIDVPNITESCEIDELGLVADMHIRATTMCRYPSFDLKEVDVRPMPQEYCTDADDIEEDSYWQGWNDCLREIERWKLIGKKHS